MTWIHGKRWGQALYAAAVCALLAAFWGLCYGSLADKSPTFDEMAHITGGYSYWATGDYRLHPENGQLPQRIAALGLLADPPRWDMAGSRGWQMSNVYTISRAFFYGGDNDPASMLRRARAAMATVATILGLLIYVLARRRYGPWGGLLALGVYALSPSFLANGGLATSDVTVSLMFLLAMVLFWETTRRLHLLSLLAGGASIGLLLVAKGSGLLVLPMVLVLSIIRFISREGIDICLWPRASGRRIVVAKRAPKAAVLAGSLLMNLLLAGVVVWCFYGFRYETMASHGVSDDLIEPWQDVLAKVGPARAGVEFARERHILPEAYLYGVSYTLSHAGNRLAFMNGQYTTGGRWSFFPYCFAVKNPLPTLAMLALALAAAVASWRATAGHFRKKVRESLYAAAPLWVLIVVYGAFAVTSSINIGHRHLLPIYPPLFVLAGAAGYWLQKGRPGQAAIGGLMVVLALQVGWSWPDYIAYFNIGAGGSSNGYRHLVDSSLDWGQDLPGLKRYLDSRPKNEGKSFSYFGTASPAYYGIRATQLPSYFDVRPPRPVRPLSAGTYCISATMLTLCLPGPSGPWNQSYEAEYCQLVIELARLDATANDEAARRRLIEQEGSAHWAKALEKFERYRFARLCAYLRVNREPDEQIGHSILVYHLSADEVYRAVFGPAPEMREKVAADE